MESHEPGLVDTVAEAICNALAYNDEFKPLLSWPWCGRWPEKGGA
jgi:hypothetical protein